MRVIFESLELEGFMSIGHSVVNLDNKGIMLIEGTNNSPGSPSSNGSGKSSIFEGIIYALTGSTLRGTTDVVNMYYDKKYCSVTLNLTVDKDKYVIQRTRNHPTHGNNLKLAKNGTDISGDKLRKSEQILAQELPMLTSSLISSVIVLGQGMPNKFTDLKPTARKERLEELSQCSEFIGELKTRLTAKTKKENEKLGAERCTESSEATRLEMSKSSLKRKNDELTKLSESDLDVDKIETELAELNAQVEEKTKFINEFYPERLNVLQTKLDQITQTIQSTNYSISTKQAEISRYSAEYSRLATSNCPTCKQSITSADTVNRLRTEIDTKRNTANEELNNLNTTLAKMNDMKTMIEPKYSQLNSAKLTDEGQVTKLRQDIAVLQTKLESAQIQSDSIIAEMQAIKDDMLKAEASLATARTNIVALTTRLGILEYLTKQTAKEFRGYLLKGVVAYLNEKVKSYGEKLFGTSSLTFSLEDNKIYVDYDNRPYENLSGGERQRADLATQFALRDMLLSNLGFSSNLLVIDEGFDNLDSSGVNALIGLISDLVGIETICVVTHHADLPIPSDCKLQVNKGINKVSEVVEVV